jgi:WXG100 family type VII secretion target
MADITYMYHGDSMRQGVGDLVQANNDIQQYLTTLETYCSNHMAEWTGDAREKYTEHKKAWDASMAEMTAVLPQASKSMNYIVNNLDEAEMVNSKRWG